MKEFDKTKTYSENNKTTVYGDSDKTVQETVHNIKVDDKIILNNNEYNICEIISESTGEAVIYRIEDTEQNLFALKLYYEFNNFEYEPNTEALSRIKNIKDVDILRLYDYGTGINKYKGKYCFEILDFAHGLDLLNVNNLKEIYTQDFIINEVIPQIFKGILKLHENRIYHCDLKPQNVFFLDKGQKEIVIGDYGSTKTFDFDAAKSSRKTTTVKGTDFYLPPEQARGFISEKNDYYSFGMILLHLLYPEEILVNENSLYRDTGKQKSLNRQKLKQIIERQFEAKPIIDYNPNYERINRLIEGLTLVNFNLRWGKEQVEKWIKGEQIEIIYRKSAQTLSGAPKSYKKSLKLGKYTITTPNNLIDYILNVPDWYAELIEDVENRKNFNYWITNYYEGDKSKRSAFNRIVRYYSQEGVDIVAEAIIRFFIPEHPVIFGYESFDFNKSNDIMKTTAYAFNFLISNLWKISANNDIKLYLFRYEFALRQIENRQKEVIPLLNILYNKLKIKEKAKPDFYDYKVYAYTSVSKDSFINIKQFLFEYFPSNISIKIIKLNEENILQYNLKRTLTNYYSEIGVNLLFELDSEETITVNYPEDYNSLEDFFKKTIDTSIESIYNKHLITREMPLEQSMEIFKSSFINAYNNLFKILNNKYYKLEKVIPGKIRRLKQVNNDLKEVKSIIKGNQYHKMSLAFYLIAEIKRCIRNILQNPGFESREERTRRKLAEEKSEIKWKIFGIIFYPLIAIAMLFGFLIAILQNLK